MASRKQIEELISESAEYAIKRHGNKKQAIEEGVGLFEALLRGTVLLKDGSPDAEEIDAIMASNYQKVIDIIEDEYRQIEHYSKPILDDPFLDDPKLIEELVKSFKDADMDKYGIPIDDAIAGAIHARKKRKPSLSPSDAWDDLYDIGKTQKAAEPKIVIEKPKTEAELFWGALNEISDKKK